MGFYFTNFNFFLNFFMVGNLWSYMIYLCCVAVLSLRLTAELNNNNTEFVVVVGGGLAAATVSNLMLS